jgi:hypothetical protein
MPWAPHRGRGLAEPGDSKTAGDNSVEVRDRSAAIGLGRKLVGARFTGRDHRVL